MLSPHCWEAADGAKQPGPERSLPNEGESPTLPSRPVHEPAEEPAERTSEPESDSEPSEPDEAMSRYLETL